MYLLIVWLPLISAIIIGLFGRFLGDKGSVFLSCFNMFFTVLISWFLFYEIVFCENISFIKIQHWLYFADLTISWGCFFDALTVSMVFIVVLISFLVHLYSSEYMSHDPYLACFMMYLSLFTFCMLILVTADNLLQMFVGWEGVGLCSFLLINFWTTRYKANFAALKAMIMNRIGDFMLILAIVLIWQIFGTLDYLKIFPQIEYFSVDCLKSCESIYSINFFFFTLNLESFFLIGFLVLLGAVSKSAQLGLHTWLPDAMEGPTPVSALIHAATMVTAGIFVLIRLNPIFESNSMLLFIVMCLGSLTAFFAGTVAIFQNDLKKVIAYSTCSQLGYMAYACGISNYSLALFHLLNHAFFKALLFLGSGVIIHALLDEQDMRKMGGLFKLLPFTYFIIFLGSIALMGFPFLTGFFSKDVLLELGSVNYFISGYFFYWLNILAAFCTAYYSYRLIYLTFFMQTSSNKFILEHIHEASPRMMFSLIFLACGSMFFGFLAKDLYIGLGSDFIFSGWGYFPNTLRIFESEFLPFYVKNIPLFFSLLGVIFCVFISKKISLFNVNNLFTTVIYNNINLFLIRTYFFFCQKWFFDIFFKIAFMNVFLKKAYFLFLIFFDRGLFEVFGPIGMLRIGSQFADKCSSIQSSYLFNYIYLLIFNIVLLLYYGFVIFMSYI